MKPRSLDINMQKHCRKFQSVTCLEQNYKSQLSNARYIRLKEDVVNLVIDSTNNLRLVE